MSSYPPVDQVRELPAQVTVTVTPDFIDENGHMNVHHYFGLQERACTAVFDALGFDETYPQRTDHGVFTLEQHLTYVSECLEGNVISAHVQVVSVSDKTAHLLVYLVNDSRDALAHIAENMIAHVDLTTRRITAWPDEALSVFAEQIATESVWAPHTTRCLKTR